MSKRRGNTRKVALIKPCEHCGSYGATFVYENESTVVQMILCDGCGEDLR